MTTAAFWVKPSTPTAETRATLRQQAAAALLAEHAPLMISRCHFCQSSDVEYVGVDADGFESYYCHNCGERFQGGYAGEADEHAPTMPPDAPADEAYADCELPSDHDLAIGVDDRVTVMRPGDLAPREATVLAVRGDGQYLVHYAFGASKWVNESDIRLRVTAAAWGG